MNFVLLSIVHCARLACGLTARLAALVWVAYVFDMTHISNWWAFLALALPLSGNVEFPSRSARAEDDEAAPSESSVPSTDPIEPLVPPPTIMGGRPKPRG